MWYSDVQKCYVRDDGYKFAPAKKEDYENFAFFLSEEDGNIYYVDNVSDKAIDRIIQLHREHSVDFGHNTNPNTYSDDYLKNLLPVEVQDDLISIAPSRYGKKNNWKMWDYAGKNHHKNIWQFVQENGIKLRHFKTSRCVKASEIC